jgi:hypothetical protein
VFVVGRMPASVAEQPKRGLEERAIAYCSPAAFVRRTASQNVSALTPGPNGAPTHGRCLTDADEFRRWEVPSLAELAVTDCQIQGDGYCLLSPSGGVGPFVRGDEIWVADVKGRVFRGLVGSWSDSAAKVSIGAEYRDSVVGDVRVALRFSPAACIVGAGQVIERFGGIPSVIYAQVSAFIFDGNDVLICGIRGGQHRKGAAGLRRVRWSY